MNVHAMALAAGDDPAAAAARRKSDNKITVLLGWSEIAEPNQCEYTFKRFVFAVPVHLIGIFENWNAYDQQQLIDDCRRKHTNSIARDALATMKSRLSTAKVASKEIGGISAQDSKLVLSVALPGSSRGDNSIHSLESLFTDLSPGDKGGATTTHQVFLVKLDLVGGGRGNQKNIREGIAVEAHERRCAAWIREAEENVREYVIKNPDSYLFDEKANMFLHRDKRRQADMRFPTYGEIVTPLVKKERFGVCIDGGIALKARRLIIESEKKRAKMLEEEAKGGGF